MSYSVKITADRITPESAAEGMAAESGWIDPQWSMTTIYAESEDTRDNVFDTETEALSFVEETIGGYVDNGDGTYYGQDSRVDFESGDDWTYAAHVTAVA